MAKLKRRYDKKEEIPGFAATLYGTATEGEGFELIADFEGVEGFEPAAKVKEFRDKNIALLKELEEIKKKRTLTDEEWDVYEQLKNRKELLDAKALVDAGKIEEVVAQRTEKMRGEHSAQIKTLQGNEAKANEQAKRYRGQLADVKVRQAAIEALGKVGTLRQGAIPDVVARARAIFQLNDDGEIEPNAGGSMQYGANGTDPLSMEEWAKDMLKGAEHLFEASQGGGGKGSGGANNQRQVAAGVKRVPRSQMGHYLAEIREGKAVVVDD